MKVGRQMMPFNIQQFRLRYDRKQSGESNNSKRRKTIYEPFVDVMFGSKLCFYTHTYTHIQHRILKKGLELTC